MNIGQRLLATLVLMLCASCDSASSYKAVYDKKEAELKPVNDSALLNPEIVSKLADGTVVKRVELQIPYTYSHYIYFVGSTITVNKEVKHGKSRSNEVTVILNGKEVSAIEAQVQISNIQLKNQEQELAKSRQLTKE